MAEGQPADGVSRAPQDHVGHAYTMVHSEPEGLRVFCDTCDVRFDLSLMPPGWTASLEDGFVPPP